MDSRAVASFRYAFSRDLIPLYASVVVGLEVLEFSRRPPLPIPHDFLLSIVAFPLYVLGLALIAGGVVGVFHRIASDAQR